MTHINNSVRAQIRKLAHAQNLVETEGPAEDLPQSYYLRFRIGKSRAWLCIPCNFANVGKVCSKCGKTRRPGMYCSECGGLGNAHTVMCSRWGL